LAHRGRSLANLTKTAELNSYAVDFATEQPTEQQALKRRNSYINMEALRNTKSPLNDERAIKLTRLNTAKGQRQGSMQVVLSSKMATSQASIGQMMHPTSKNDESSKLKKENIKAKVGHEWKQIFKNLTKFDTHQNGTVTKS